MISKCNGCGAHDGQASLLGVGCAMLPTGLAVVAVSAQLGRWSLWFLPFAPLVLLLGLQFAWFAPRWLAALRNRFRRCPSCGSCDWAPPENGDFDRLLEMHSEARPMLEGLDEIDWNAVRHAGGPATDAPDMIRALASPDKAVRKRALEWAEYQLCYQGLIVYEATFRAMPFLVELLRSPAVACKPQILRLLLLFASGNSFHHAHQHLDDVFPLAGTEDWQVEMRKELGWVEGIRREAAAGAPVYLELLAHEDSAVRSAAALALARFGSEPAAVEAAARARLDVEYSPSVRADLVMLLQNCWLVKGVVPYAGFRPREFFLDRVRSKQEPPAVRFVSAALVVACDGLDLQDEVYDVFLETLDGCGSYFEESAFFQESNATLLVLKVFPNRLDLQVRWLEALAGHADPQRREEALRQARELCGERRSALKPLAPILFGGLADADADVRRTAGCTVPYLGKLRHTFAPAVQLLASTHPSQEVRKSAAAAMHEIRKPRRAHECVLDSSLKWTFTDVAALVAILESKGDSPDPSDRSACDEAIKQLSSAGRAAIAAAPALRARTKSSSKWERLRAARALWRIGGAAEDVVPVLCAEIHDGDASLLAMRMLEDMGPAASAALPELRRFLERDVRPYPSSNFDDVIDEDEALCDAAADAIARIEAGAAGGEMEQRTVPEGSSGPVE